MAEIPRRKLTTVMIADVCGYSRLMEADEADTLARLVAYRDAMAGFIDRHRGQVVNTAGDSLLAEFDSVVEAVQCAAEIQRELGARNAELDGDRQMRFRIGINLGDVMVQGDDLYGEGVNVAARLQTLAKPGGICISGTAYDQVHNKLTLGYDFIGRQPVKNIAEEIPVYRVRLDAAAGFSGGAAQSAPPIDSIGHRAVEAGMARRVYLLFLLSLVFAFGALIAAAATDRHAFCGGGGEIAGDTAFTEDGAFSGKIGGNVVVAPGVRVSLGGKVEGDLVLGPGAVAEVSGKIGGDVINHGGTLRLRGKLDGSERRAPAEAYAGPAATRPAAGAGEAQISGQAGAAPLADSGVWSHLPALLAALFALTLLGGVVLAYVGRGDGTSWVDSHYRFQIRTFWIGALGTAVGAATTLFVVGIVILVLLPFWLLIRCIRGWRFLAQGVPHPLPGSWLTG